MPTPEELAAAQTAANGGASDKGVTPESFDKFLEGQPDPIKLLYQQHSAGLLNTVKATRQERDDLAKQIKELLPKAEKGSELEKALLELQQKNETSERRATFIEESVKPEIGCRNPKAAYALAMADNLFDRRGAPDWNAIKNAAPELFGKPANGANANAGAGSGSGQVAANDMNDFILRASGRRR